MIVFASVVLYLVLFLNSREWLAGSRKNLCLSSLFLSVSGLVECFTVCTCLLSFKCAVEEEGIHG